MYYKFDKLKKPHYNDPIQASNYGLAAEENYILNQSPFKHLSELILECVRQYNFEILNYKVDRWKFTQSWLAYKSNGQEHKTHFHPNSIISGILFFHEEHDNSDVQYYNEICAHMPPTLFYENGEETGEVKPGIGRENDYLLKMAIFNELKELSLESPVNKFL